MAGNESGPEAGIKGVAEGVKGKAKEGVGTVTGRYYAMDRDRRWDRTKRAWDAIVLGRAEHEADTGEAAVQAAVHARFAVDLTPEPVFL